MNNRFSRLGNRGINRKNSFPTAVPGIVGAWQAYGKTNESEDRDVLKDLSGNGRDIRLYNFAFAGMSGFGGYSENYNEYYNFGTSYNIVTPISFEVVGSYMGIHYLIALQQPREIPSYKIKVSGVTEGHPLLYRYHIADGTPTILELYNGIHVLPKSYINETDTERVGFMGEGGFQIGVKVEQLPLYPGGLVSDGVDDYGKCIKGFALPNDYTVVVVRKMLSTVLPGTSSLVCKGLSIGAFSFEGTPTTINCFSYGGNNYFPASQLPSLFSYQTKTHYNDKTLNVGTSIDNNTIPLTLFIPSSVVGSYMKAVLYDLRIYDHSLSDEELQLVKDEMMSDYEKYAKPLDGIHYVCDFDAKGRSNDEEEPARSK